MSWSRSKLDSWVKSTEEKCFKYIIRCISERKLLRPLNSMQKISVKKSKNQIKCSCLTWSRSRLRKILKIEWIATPEHTLYNQIHVRHGALPWNIAHASGIYKVCSDYSVSPGCCTLPALHVNRHFNNKAYVYSYSSFSRRLEYCKTSRRRCKIVNIVR